MALVWFLGHVSWLLQFHPCVFSCVDLIIVAYCLCDYVLYLAIATFDGFPGAKVFRLVKMFRIIRSLRAVRVLRTVRSTRVFTPYYARFRCIKRVGNAGHKKLGRLIVTYSSLPIPQNVRMSCTQRLAGRQCRYGVGLSSECEDDQDDVSSPHQVNDRMPSK